MFAVSSALKAPRSKSNQVISRDKIIPPMVLAVSKNAKNQKAFFMNSLACVSSLFLMYLATLGKRAMEVAMAKSASGS